LPPSSILFVNFTRVFIYSAGIELVLARQALCHLSCVPSSLLLYLGEALEFLSGTGFGPPMDACLVAGIIEHTTIGLFVEVGGVVSLIICPDWP
jgi:hypothetical protein